ncbi:MAG: class I SAM-dependent methyltransferase [Chitinophagaceae bacterium]
MANQSVSNDEIIQSHYKIQAEKHKDSSSSTMEDTIIRQKELESIFSFFNLREVRVIAGKVLEIGCGNGYTLQQLAAAHPQTSFHGMDFSHDLLAIAEQRKISNGSFSQGDVRKLAFENASVDIVYTERCLINLLTWEDQQKALTEIHRVLKKGGFYFMVESFTDGFDNLNKARNELGLNSIPVAHHNLYFDKESFKAFIHPLFAVAEPSSLGTIENASLQYNFLSSHYFSARVLHPLLTKGDPNLKNTELVKFFSFLPPSGNYGPIQAHILQKR